MIPSGLLGFLLTAARRALSSWNRNSKTKNLIAIYADRLALSSRIQNISDFRSDGRIDRLIAPGEPSVAPGVAVEKNRVLHQDEVFNDVGLLFNKPPGTVGLPFIKLSDGI